MRVFFFTKVIDYSANSCHKCSKTQSVGVSQTRMFIFSGHFCVCKHKQLNGLYFTVLSKSRDLSQNLTIKFFNR